MESQETQILPDGFRNIALGPGVVLSGRYRLDSELGRGGMGIVFRATDLELMREVGVKVLPAATPSPDARQRLLREARAAAERIRPTHCRVPIASIHGGGCALEWAPRK